MQKAHRRRHGEEGIGYIDEESQHLQLTEMKRIANDVLPKLNLRLIKSKETVRAFGNPGTEGLDKQSSTGESQFGHSLVNLRKKTQPDTSMYIITGPTLKITQNWHLQR